MTDRQIQLTELQACKDRREVLKRQIENARAYMNLKQSELIEESRTLTTMKIETTWTPTGQSSHASHYESIASSGKYFTLADYEDGSQCVDEYPSYRYMKNWILCNNQGKQIKTYWFNK